MTLQERLDAAEREREAFAERVFRHGFSDGWTANQKGRLAASASVDEAWHFYVADGALQKSIEATPPTPATDEREAVARAMACEDLGYLTPFMQSNWLERADRAISALAPYRAAEILAAEANERARALGQAAEHINRLEAALRGLLSTVERLDISEGVCCCGDDMATHAEPMSCGHTPVDAGHYHHGNAIQQARDATEHGAGK